MLKMSSYYHFEKNPPVLKGAKFALPVRPGFGIELDHGGEAVPDELELKLTSSDPGNMYRASSQRNLQDSGVHQVPPVAPHVPLRFSALN